MIHILAPVRRTASGRGSHQGAQAVQPTHGRCVVQREVKHGQSLLLKLVMVVLPACLLNPNSYTKIKIQNIIKINKQSSTSQLKTRPFFVKIPVLLSVLHFISLNKEHASQLQPPTMHHLGRSGLATLRQGLGAKGHPTVAFCKLVVQYYECSHPKIIYIYI